MAVIAKYKFDKSIYENLIPEFNSGYTGYTISDEIDSVDSNHIIRTIECDILPTRIDFGVGGTEEQYTDRSDSLLAIYNLDVSAVTDGNRMVKGCRYMTKINTSNWDTSNVTDMAGMFQYCKNLIELDVSGFNTSNVTNMSYMFYGCNKLTSLDVSNWNIGKVRDMYAIFAYCGNLTSLDVSNWDTSNVTVMRAMFYNCEKLTSLDVSNFNTSRVTDMYCMFCGCNNLTSIDVSNWDTSRVNTMIEMFLFCQSLTSLDVSNWNTSNVITMAGMFECCNNLITLDISNWNIGNVNNMNLMFYDCGLVTDIGMIYCDFKTVEKVAAVVPTDNTTTIWVGRHIDFDALPQYDHITYKVYEVEDKLEVELSSPLLEGDRLEIIDGDLYHYHKMGIVEFDGNTKIDLVRSVEHLVRVQRKLDNISASQDCNLISDKLKFIDGSFNDFPVDIIQEGIKVQNNGAFNIFLNKNRLKTGDLNGVYDWLNNNPVTLVYELENPYYELVKPNVGLLNAEQGLYLNISDSVVPVVNHQDLCTLKLNYLLPNVQYKVKFKANNPGSIAINLGGTLVPLDVVEGWNEVMVTTPETLESEYLEVSGPSEIKIQNVMVIDSDKDFDYFKGMNNTFDEIPVNNLVTQRTLTYLHGTDEYGVSPQMSLSRNIDQGKIITVVGKVSNNPDNLPISINLYNNTGRATGKNLFNNKEGLQYSEVITSGVNNSVEGVPWMWYMINFANKKIRCSSNLIPIKQNTNYTIQIHEDYRIVLHGCDESMKRISKSILPSNWSSSNTVTINSNTMCYLSCYVTHKDIVSYDNANNNPQFLTEDHLSRMNNSIQLEEGTEASAYEPFRNYVNDEPIFISPDENGNFAIQIKTDRDYANRIGFNIDNSSSMAEGEQVQLTDLMVYEGDFIDCYPTTWQDFAKTYYLAEYKSYGNPYGFGKNRLI